jgi:3',5'-cyclic-AMP phosphodiesterase
MSELERERREIATVLQEPGLRPDPALKITRRSFIHRSCLFGAATVAETFAWWPLLNTLDVAYAAEAPFKFAWISDTHLYPRSASS